MVGIYIWCSSSFHSSILCVHRPTTVKSDSHTIITDTCAGFPVTALPFVIALLTSSSEDLIVISCVEHSKRRLQMKCN